MKSRHKHWRGGLILVLLGLVAALIYGRVGLLPGSLRQEAMDRIEEWTGKKVVFDRLVFVPFHGFSFYKVGVFEPDGRPIFRARRITLNARLLPFLREKRIIVDRCLLEKPVLDWNPSTFPAAKPEPPPKTVISGQLDVPVAGSPRSLRLEDVAEGPDSFLPENVYLQRIEISDGRLVIRPSADSEPTEVLSSVNIRLTLPHPPLLRFEGRIDIGEKPYAFIDLTGVWDLERGRYEFDLKSATDRIPPWLLDYQKGHFLILREGALSLDAKIFSQNEEEVFFRTRAGLRGAVLTMDPSSYSGQMRLEAEGSFDPVWKRIRRYRGQLELIKVRAERLSSAIERLDSLSGLIKFEPDLLVIRSLKGEYRHVGFDAAGTIRSFKELEVNGEIRSALTMNELRSILPETERQKIKDFALTGDAQALTRLSGSLKKGSKVTSEYRILVQNGSVRNDAKKIHWSNLSGEIEVGNDGIRFSDASFLLAGKKCRLNAFLPRSERAPGKFQFEYDGLMLRSHYRMNGEDLTLSGGVVSIPGFNGRFEGSCLHWSRPYVRIQGSYDADTADLIRHFSMTNASLKALKLTGGIRGPWTLEGSLQDPSTWQIKADGSGSPLRWDRWFLMDELKFQLRYAKGQLRLPLLHATAYGGTIGAKIEADLTKRSPVFQSEIYISSLDLARLGPDKIPPDPKLKGTVIGNTTLSGRLGEPSTYRGDGALSITNGFLGQSSQFKAMGNLPLVKVEGLDLVTFEEMNATFRIADGRIHTQDLSLYGDSVDLSLEGSVGFDQTLDMTMDIQFSEEVFRGAALTGGLAPLMVNEAKRFISLYKVSGTLKEPRYDKMLLPGGRSVGKRLGGLLRSVVS